MKLPAFQFYPGDWRKDPGVQSLSFHDRGVWFEIICLMHESDQRGKLMLNGAPMPIDALSRLLGLDNQILTKTLTNLSTYGITSVCPETGAIMSRRMVRDEEIRQVRKSCGKLGGNPNLVNQNPTTQVNQKSTPSSSSSSSSSDQEEEKRARVPRFTPPTLQEVVDYCRERGTGIDGERFWHYYESNGWRVGRNPMKSWKAAVTTWEKTNGTNRTHSGGNGRPETAAERNLRKLKANLGINGAGGSNPPPDRLFLSGRPQGAAGTGNS